MRPIIQTDKYSILKTVVGPFQCNCYALICEQSGEIALVDPGDEPAAILKMIEPVQENFKKNGLIPRVKYLFQTHGHLDHIGASREMKEATTAQICLHRNDEPLYRMLKKQGELFGLNHYQDPLDIDVYVEDQQCFQIGKMKCEIIHIPGHSPGSVGIRLHEDSEAGTKEMLWSGDTLFQESVGRTDLWMGNQNEMFKSINSRLFSLDGDTRVFPGHGASTSIKHEIENNPFVGVNR